MIHPSRSLFLKIFLWFLMSLVLLIGLVAGIFKLDFHFRPESTLFSGLGGQGKALGRVILRELYDSRYDEWGSILERFGSAYGLDLILCRPDGHILAGPERPVPSEVMDALTRVEQPTVRVSQPPRHPPPGMDGHRGGPPRNPPPRHMAPEGQDRPPFGLLPLPPAENLRFQYLVRTSDPVRYWACVPVPFHDRREKKPANLFLLAASPSITGNGLFFNPVPWLLLAGLVLAASILLWIPLVRSITRPVIHITGAAEEIARGNFNIHIEEKRTDEIGRLGAAINHMSGQLENHIMGQKRFLGDIAHELASPIARMELGLSIFEQRLKGEDRSRLLDITEEVHHMSNLINELLSFTRAEIGRESEAPQTVSLTPMILEAMAREAKAGVEIVNHVSDDISVWVVPSLFRRAVSNVLRNAVRYAGPEGPIEIMAENQGDKVLVAVKDRGPGVPEKSMPRLFEPFYRPEAARNRKSGGVGLGLAIVKTCIQACGGTVHAENCSPKGFSVTLELFAAKPSTPSFEKTYGRS